MKAQEAMFNNLKKDLTICPRNQHSHTPNEKPNENKNLFVGRWFSGASNWTRNSVKVKTRAWFDNSNPELQKWWNEIRGCFTRPLQDPFRDKPPTEAIIIGC